MRYKDRSYGAYLRNRERLSEKGYSLDPVLSADRFSELFALAKSAGMKNIARTFALGDRPFGLRPSDVLKDLRSKLSAPGMTEEAKKYLGEKYGTFAKIKALDKAGRTEFWNDMIGAGISFSEARGIY